MWAITKLVRTRYVTGELSEPRNWSKELILSHLDLIENSGKRESRRGHSDVAWVEMNG